MLNALYIPKDKQALLNEAADIAATIQYWQRKLNVINNKINAQSKHVDVVDVDSEVVAGLEPGKAARVAFGKKHFYVDADELFDIKQLVHEKINMDFVKFEHERELRKSEKQKQIMQRRIAYAEGAKAGPVVVTATGNR